LTWLLMLITVPGLNMRPAYNIDPLWSILKCYVTLARIYHVIQGIIRGDPTRLSILTQS
jgi:hypothetical protein